MSWSVRDRNVPNSIAKLDWRFPIQGALKVRPGITGLAQLRLPADTTLECVRKKVEYDIYYVAACHPWLDLKLMVFTAFRLVRESSLRLEMLRASHE